MPRGRLRVCTLALFPFLTFAQHPVDPDEGTLSSVRPRIPEPMVFDLVRPLGAKRGELEVNSLFRVPLTGSHRTLQWAPEVEYAFADGFGIEFELPVEGRRIESYKAAIQATLPGPAPARLIQGVQAIGEAGRKNWHQTDLLYLAGYRFNPRWSSFSMAGIRREHDNRTAVAPIYNQSVFHESGRHVTTGVETNWKGKGGAARSLLVMPQMHWRANRLNVQAGAGLLRTERASSAIVGWRISREF